MALYFEDTLTEKPPLLLIAGLASDELSWTFQKEALETPELFNLAILDALATA